MIYIGADHRGYELKEKIASWLFEWETPFADLGADHFDSGDDYPLFAQRVASLVANENDSLGILLCGSGVGVDVAANKFDGIRSSIGISADQVKAGRSDDGMNILVIAADFTKDEDAKEMVKVFLETSFSGKARHEKRIEEIEKIEKNN